MGLTPRQRSRGSSRWRWPATQALVLGLASGMLGRTGDWPLYRGPFGDGISPERIRLDWPAEGPKPIWRVPLTHGFSSLTVGNGKVFTQVRRTIGGERREVAIALDADTGRELWAQALGPANYDGGAAGYAGGSDGPRSTPVIHGGRVYVLTSWLALYSLAQEDGRIEWSHDLIAEYGGRNISWQSAASPVIEQGLVLVASGASNQSLMAFRAEDGVLAWKGQSDRITQATPVVTTIQGVRQAIFYTQTGLVSVAPLSGEVLWRYNHRFSTSSAASPVVADDIVYCSAAYYIGAATARITLEAGNFKTNALWKDINLMNHWSSPVSHQGHLYGLYGYGEYQTAPLKCVEAATGTEKWSVDGFGFGGLIFVDGHLLVLSDTGSLVVVKADPAAYTEVARFQALSGACWNVPVISNGRIYARSTTEAAAFDVALAPPPPLRFDVPTFVEEGVLRLWLVSSAGGDVDPARADGVKVYASDDLATPWEAWTLLTDPVMAEGGALRVDTSAGTSGLRYFIAVESP